MADLYDCIHAVRKADMARVIKPHTEDQRWNNAHKFVYKPSHTRIPPKDAVAFAKWCGWKGWLLKQAADYWEFR